jgi:hypothetical protein
MAAPRLFDSVAAFVDEALAEVYDDRAIETLDVERDGGFLAFNAPEDLEARLTDLPRTYLTRLREPSGQLRLRLTFDKHEAAAALAASRQGRETLWPTKGFLSDIHPVVDWLVDKVLVRLDRQQAPVLTTAVSQPTFLVQGVYCNQFGQPTVVEWMAVTDLPGPGRVGPMEEALTRAGVGPGMTNPQAALDLAALQALVPAAVATAREHLERERDRFDERVAEPLHTYLDRLDGWVQHSLPLATREEPAGRDVAASTKRERAVRETERRQRELVDRLRTTGEPMLRVLAVLAPLAGGAR